MSDFLDAENEEMALEQLHDMGCTDGLPVVIPTQERVIRCILASGLDGDMVIGELGPGMGIATVEKVATAAVMAGCKSDYMPLVIAAVKAAAKPEFDLAELQATTHCTAPLIIVNGQLAKPVGRSHRVTARWAQGIEPMPVLAERSGSV